MQNRIAKSSCFSAVFVAVAACADDIAAPNTSGLQPVPEVSSPQYQIAAAVGGRTERGVEDEILRLEAEIPGLGGLFIDESGDVVILVPPTVNPTRLRAELSSRALQVRLGDRVREALTTGAGLKIRSSEYSFSQLVAWRITLAARLVAMREVLYTDANEATNRVEVTVESTDANAAVLQAASDAQVPASAIEITVGLRPIPAATLREVWRPTGGGVEIGIAGEICTLGYNVMMNGLTGFLTASHCSAAAIGSGELHESVRQPVFGSIIGTVHTNPAFNYSHTDCGSYLCARADAMFALYTDPTDGHARAAKPAGPPATNNTRGSITVSGWDLVASSSSPLLMGAGVMKVGRSTGWTLGTLAATCISTPVGGYVIVCASRVTNAQAGEGDSGAPVFSSANRIGLPHIREGILFAFGGIRATDPNGFEYCTSQCSFLYSRWSEIEAHLGAAISSYY